MASQVGKVTDMAWGVLGMGVPISCDGMRSYDFLRWQLGSGYDFDLQIKTLLQYTSKLKQCERVGHTNSVALLKIGW